MRAVIAVALWLVVCIGFADSVSVDGLTFEKTAKVLDGDTLEVTINNTPVLVRLFGIACPKEDQPLAKTAKDFTVSLCNNTSLTLSIEAVSERVLWANIILPDGRKLNRELVRQGYAWWNRNMATGDKDLQNAEFRAKQEKSGVWLIEDLTPPWERKIVPKWARAEKDKGFLDPENWAKRRKAAAQRARAASVPLVPAEEYVFTDYGECYHRMGCRTIEDSENVYVATRQDIEERNLRRCMVCNPE